TYLEHRDTGGIHSPAMTDRYLPKGGRSSGRVVRPSTSQAVPAPPASKALSSQRPRRSQVDSGLPREPDERANAPPPESYHRRSITRSPGSVNASIAAAAKVGENRAGYR